MSSTDRATIVIDGKEFGGWQQIRVSRGLERTPSDFDVSLTELYPGIVERVAIKEGQACQVYLGDDLVVTGYIDRVVPKISPGNHTLRIQGRGKCQDLVDCSAGIRADGTYSTQISGGTALSIATDLAAPFGISVKRLDDEAGSVIPQFNVNLGESPWEIIDRVTRYRKLLAYEDAEGNLVLARVGSTKMASGFAEGANIENGQASFSMDGRFSQYYVVWTSTDGLRQERLALNGPNGLERAFVRDDTVPRFRPRIIVSEQTLPDQDIGKARAEWEMNRRNGLAQVLRVTCDSWRDSAGTLWAPNMLVPARSPRLKLDVKGWCIGDVTYRRGADGTHADITLLPPQAFEPQPSTLQAIDFQVHQALQESRGGAATSSTPPTGSTR